MSSSISCDGCSSDQLEPRESRWGERGVDTAGRRSGSVVSPPRSHERTQSPVHSHASPLPPPAPRLDAATLAPASAPSEQNNGVSLARGGGMGWSARGGPGVPGGRSGCRRVSCLSLGRCWGGLKTACHYVKSDGQYLKSGRQYVKSGGQYLRSGRQYVKSGGQYLRSAWQHLRSIRECAAVVCEPPPTTRTPPHRPRPPRRARTKQWGVTSSQRRYGVECPRRAGGAWRSVGLPQSVVPVAWEVLGNTICYNQMILTTRQRILTTRSND